MHDQLSVNFGESEPRTSSPPTCRPSPYLRRCASPPPLSHHQPSDSATDSPTCLLPSSIIPYSPPVRQEVSSLLERADKKQTHRLIPRFCSFQHRFSPLSIVGCLGSVAHRQRGRVAPSWSTCAVLGCWWSCCCSRSSAERLSFPQVIEVILAAAESSHDALQARGGRC